MLITISRQYGAGGSRVAERVAQELGWSVVDNELIDRVAVRAGFSRETVAAHDERAPSFVERLARTLANDVPEPTVPRERAVPVPELEERTLVRMTELVVKEVAAEGRVVLVGRAAPAVIGSKYDALHIKLVASKAYRLSVATARLGVSAKEAEAILHSTDQNRARFHRQYYGRDWDDPINYHLVLNTGLLGLDEVVEVIVERSRVRWKGTSLSRPDAPPGYSPTPHSG